MDESSSTFVQIIETIFYIMVGCIKMFKFLIGLLFFMMNYFITNCIIMVNDVESDGICSYFDKDKKWFIHRVTAE